MNELQRTLAGERTADTVVTDGAVLNTRTGRFLDKDVVIVGDTVAGLVADAGPLVGDETTVHDASGNHVVPGFIDPHAHLDMHVDITRLFHQVLAGGTTTIVNELIFLGATLGARGTSELLDATADIPLDVRIAVAAHELFDTFEPPHGDESTIEDLRGLVSHPRSVGVGETVWLYVVDQDSPAEALFEHAHDEGKVVVGHGAACRGRNYTSFATIVDNDHEPITSEQVAERLDHDVHVVGRYGSTRDDIDAIADAYDEFGPEDISLSTDGVAPRKLLADGYMDATVGRAIEAGIEPVDAIRMATVTTADHFNLYNKGTIAPGQDADMVILSDLEAVEVETVIAGGETVVDDGEPLTSPVSYGYPDWMTETISLPAEPDRFEVSIEAADDGRINALEYKQELVTERVEVEPPVQDGNLCAEPDTDIAKVSIIDRYPSADGANFTGFVKGLGLEQGAIGTTLTVERTGVLLVGMDNASMQTALDTIVDMQGGWVAADGETVLDSIQTTIGATCADRPVATVADEYGDFEATVRDLGISIDRPLFGLQTLCHPGVPSFRISFSGYADTLGQKIVGLEPSA